MRKVRNDRVGESTINNQGLKMTIIKYNKSNDIDVEFEDGYISRNKKYDSFLKGMIENKNFPYSTIGKSSKCKGVIRTNRYDEMSINNQGLSMRIIKYESCLRCHVLFEDGYETVATYNNFKKGNIKNPNYKRAYIKTKNGIVLGIGITDSVTVDEEGHTLNSYSKWMGMIERCYGDPKKHFNYVDCEVCDEWKYYSNFKKWYDENFYNVGDEVMHLDKDILFKNNKIYSPQTCIFVPQRINSLFAYRKKTSKNVRCVECVGTRYRVRVNDKENNKISLGLYNTEEEAFAHYKKYKEEYIKNIADEYKDKIPQELYLAMYSWEVEIDD